MSKMYMVYILSNKNNTTLYIGITSNPKSRIYEHKTKAVPGFSATYNLDKLIYYEVFEDPESAILREKRLKKWNRKWKDELIKKMNPEWKDLYEELETDG